MKQILISYRIKETNFHYLSYKNQAKNSSSISVSREPLEELEFSEFVLEMEEICSICVNITSRNYEINSDDLFPESASVYIHLPARKQLIL